MKEIIAICVLLCIQLQLTASDKLIETESDIQHVTVYRNYADVHRTAFVSVPEGSSEIVLENLSNAIDYRSLQVKMPSEVILLSAAQRQNHLVKKKKTDEILQVEDTISDITTQLQFIQNKIQTLTEEEQLILANKIVAGSETGISSEELMKLAGFYRERLLEIKDERTQFSNWKGKRQERLSTYQSQLNELNRNLNKPTGEVILQVRAEKAREIKIDFSYLVTNASWAPSYDIRVKEVGQPIELLYKASIAQNTGIDWEGVSLTINTGNPAIGLDRPKLPAWYIDFTQPGYRQQGVDKQSGYYGNLRLESGSMNLAQESIIADAATVDRFVEMNENQLNVSFRIDLPYNIPSDGRGHLVAMKTDELPAEYQHHTVPKLEEATFLLAKVTDWEALNLLPGPANIFLEDTYVGSSGINPNIPSDTMLLSLGRDQKVLVDCKTIKEFTKTRTIGLNKKQTFAYEVTVRNTKSVAVNVEVLKNIPISQNGDIKVALEEKSKANYNEKLGKLTWDLELKPGESKTVTLIYTVKYPKNKFIPNL